MISDKLQLLYSQETIERRTRDLARAISADYHGRHLIIIGVLKGCFVFMADIIRNLELDITIDFVQISSYGSCTESSGTCTLVKDLGIDIAGRDVLVVEDIIDTGDTLAYLLNALRQRGPASVRVCALLNKETRRRRQVSIDYYGFLIGDEFIVGFGLDYDERYRSLPGIYVLSEAQGAGHRA